MIFVLLITTLLSCSNNQKQKLEGIYYYPNSCEVTSDNNFKSKTGNCLTIEFPENSNKFIFTEHNSSKDPWIEEYFVIKTGNKELIKVKLKNGEIGTLFEMDKNGNLRCVYKGIVGKGGMNVIWKKK